ncbi:MAG TPA: thioredoxin family protein [Phycisphaerae bacterium]|nr:thioredoxin family protein [Phycisphaerae bacterium]
MRASKSLLALVAAVCVLAGGGVLSADDSSAGEVQWMTDMKQAIATANKEHKVILMDFTGSDWCGWCKKLDKDVYSTPEFKKLAKEKLVLLQLDYPNAKPQSDELKKQNKELKDKFKVTGYPTNVFLSPSEKELGRIDGYEPKDDWFKSANDILAKGDGK